MANQTDNIKSSTFLRLTGGAAITTSSAGQFYNPSERVSERLQDGIDRALKSGPVKQIDPSTREPEKLTPEQIRRFKSRQILKGRWGYLDPTLKSIRSQRKPLTEKQIDLVFVRYYRLKKQFGHWCNYSDWLRKQRKRNAFGHTN